MLTHGPKQFGATGRGRPDRGCYDWTVLAPTSTQFLLNLEFLYFAGASANEAE